MLGRKVDLGAGKTYYLHKKRSVSVLVWLLVVSYPFTATLRTSSELSSKVHQAASPPLAVLWTLPPELKRWIHQARFLLSEDFPSWADLISSPMAISNKLLRLLTLFLLLYWCLFTLDIGGRLLETIQTNGKKNCSRAEPSRSSYQRILLIGPLALALALARRYNWSRAVL